MKPVMIALVTLTAPHTVVRREYVTDVSLFPMDIISQLGDYPGGYKPLEWLSLTVDMPGAIKTLVLKPECHLGCVLVVGHSLTESLRLLNDFVDSISTSTLTPHEVAERYAEKLLGLVEYWADPIRSVNTKEAMVGLCHSICSTLAGTAIDLPGVHMVPMTNDEDNSYRLRSLARPYPDVRFGGVAQADFGHLLYDAFNAALSTTPRKPSPCNTF